MSSILKALKQLETESDPQTPSQGLPNSWRNRPKSEPPPQSRFSGNIFRPGPVGLGILALVVILGAIFFKRPTPEPEPTRPMAHKITAPVPPMPPPQAPKPAPSPLKGRVAQSKAIKIPPSPLKPKPPAKPENPPQRQTGSRVQTAKVAPREKLSTPSPQTSQPLLAAKTGPTAPVSKSKAPASPVEKPSQGSRHNTPVKSDPRISIQAIAWSQEPAERMAVVNGMIYKEGDTLEGMSVKAIEKDGIVFAEDGRRWKQGL